LICKLFLQSSL